MTSEKSEPPEGESALKLVRSADRPARRRRRFTAWAALMRDGRELDGREKCRVLLSWSGEEIVAEINRPIVFIANDSAGSTQIRFFAGPTGDAWLFEMDADGVVVGMSLAVVPTKEDD